VHHPGHVAVPAPDDPLHLGEPSPLAVIADAEDHRRHPPPRGCRSAPAHRRRSLEALSSRSAAARASAAAAPAAGRSRCGGAAAAGHRDRGQQLHRVVVTPWTGGRRGRLAHGAVDLERVAAGAAPELVTRHDTRD